MSGYRGAVATEDALWPDTHHALQGYFTPDSNRLAHERLNDVVEMFSLVAGPTALDVSACWRSCVRKLARVDGLLSICTECALSSSTSTD